MPGMKQRYERTYVKGRPTAGWDRGERLRSVADIQPGDYVIEVCHQFQAENLARVIPLPDGYFDTPGRGFYSVWADNRTGEQLGPDMMFTWADELAGERNEFYRAIDRRPVDPRYSRIRADRLPTWLSYSK